MVSSRWICPLWRQYKNRFTIFGNTISNVNSGSCDDYNFYYSQVCIWITLVNTFSITHYKCGDVIFLLWLCICVEFTFGMLVQGWEILPWSLSSHFSIAKITVLVSALAKLNYRCIDCCEKLPFNQQIKIVEDLQPDIQRRAFHWSGYVEVERD